MAPRRKGLDMNTQKRRRLIHTLLSQVDGLSHRAAFNHVRRVNYFSIAHDLDAVGEVVQRKPFKMWQLRTTPKCQSKDHRATSPRVHLKMETRRS